MFCPHCILHRRPGEYLRSHRLEQCCPRCNDVDHDFDSCLDRKKLQTQPELDDDAWKWLVEKRGRLPPIRSIIAWPELAANRPMPLNGYPATKEFAAYKLSQDPHEFRWYSYRCPPERFLDDPVTAQPLQTESLHFLEWLSHMERYHPF